MIININNYSVPENVSIPKHKKKIDDFFFINAEIYFLYTFFKFKFLLYRAISFMLCTNCSHVLFKLELYIFLIINHVIRFYIVLLLIFKFKYVYENFDATL